MPVMSPTSAPSPSPSVPAAPCAALAVVAAGGFALLWWGRATLTGLRLGLVLLAVAALAGWLWP